MKDARRVIHYSQRIYRGEKHIVDEAFAYVVGKARTYEEHLLLRLDGKLWGWYVNYSSKFHDIDLCNEALASAHL